MANRFTNTQQYKESVERDKSAIALVKAKKLEAKRIKNGWRYIKLSNMTQVFVPCDKSGKPTEEGQMLIEQVLNR